MKIDYSTQKTIADIFEINKTIHMYISFKIFTLVNS